MVELDVRDDRDLTVSHVRRVPPAEQPDLDHDDVDRHVGEPAVRGGGQDLEVRRFDAGQRLGVGHAPDRLAELVVADGRPVDRDALVDPLQVRAGVGADREPVDLDQAGRDLGGRALPVRAGDVHERRGVLGVAEHVHEPLHALERGVRVAIGDDRLEVDVLVEVTQRGSEIHRDLDGA